MSRKNTKVEVFVINFNTAILIQTEKIIDL